MTAGHSLPVLDRIAARGGDIERLERTTCGVPGTPLRSMKALSPGGAA